MYAFERDIIEFMKMTHGREGGEIIKYVMKHPGATDEEISNKLEMRENIIRKVLYDVYAWNGVELQKKRMSEGRNYEFRWKINYAAFYKHIIAYYNDEIERLKEGLTFLESVDFYTCGKPHHPVMTIDEALDYEFKCPLCGEILHNVDMSGEKENIMKKIESIEEKIQKIERHYELFKKKKIR